MILLGKNRDRISIVASILTVTISGATKTHIMHRANLNYKLLERYLDLVVGSRLVRIEGSRYLLTNCGRDFLKRYALYQERCAETEKSLRNLATEREGLSHLCQGHQMLDSITASI